MPPRPSPPTPWRQRLLEEWLLGTFALLVLALAWFDPRPLADYRDWLQLPTLAGLTGLLLAVQGILDSGLVQRAAGRLLARMHSMRATGLLLVACAAVLSTVLTNDVSLFLIVPLTLALGRLGNLPVARMVVLEALAVNAGSTLSPIGNPQNLLLWQHARMPFLQFVADMAPAAVVMLVLLAALTWLWLPPGRVGLASARVGAVAVDRRLAAGSALALLAMVVLMEYRIAWVGTVLLAALFALLARPSLRRVDWLLLATFAAIFVGLGHFAQLPPVITALHGVDFSQPSMAYVGGIVAAQLVSNVPATVLLLEHSPDAIALAVAVNVGGFGLATGSLANLIALRLARQPGGLRLFHLVSIPFLLVCAPLVYLSWRWLL
jgi:Na+/H+ antiporter NhaD/arsenite permease-like protein